MSTKEEFAYEMAILEASLDRRKLTDEQIVLRRVAMQRAVGDFPLEILQEACGRYCRQTEEAEWKQFPLPGELRRLCLDVIEEAKSVKARRELLISKFKPQEHECANNHEKSEARSRLVLLPYEVEHVFCQGKIKSTCPRCGALTYVVDPMIAQTMKEFPEQTKGWNPAHKGLLLCKKCYKEFNDNRKIARP
jgi:hypothetical protein